MEYVAKTVVRRSKEEGDKARRAQKVKDIADAAAEAGKALRGRMHETINEFATAQRMKRWG